MLKLVDSLNLSLSDASRERSSRSSDTNRYFSIYLQCKIKKNIYLYKKVGGV